jgi:addiction module HigA family antidote
MTDASLSASKTRPWDSAEHLKTDKDTAEYFDACLVEGGNDLAFITHAVGVIARACAARPPAGDFLRMNRPVDGMRPIHPGEFLREDFLAPLDMSVAALARALHVSADRIRAIVNERRGITADTAYRLARYFDTTPEFWLNLQAMYDLKTLPTSAEIERRVEPREPAHA